MNKLSESEEKMRTEIMDGGRRLAEEWLQSTIQSGQGGNEILHQIRLLEYAAIHLLGACAMNHELNAGKDLDGFLNRIFNQIRFEHAFMRTAHAEGRLQVVAEVTTEVGSGKSKLNLKRIDLH